MDKGGECIEQISVGPKSCYVLGRSEELSDIWLQHPSISRQHAAIVHDKNEQICLVDLDSAQGTFVNGKEIEPNAPQALKVGDRIQFGASTRTYVFQNAVGEEETAQKEGKHTATASADPELLRMMREMQSFGDKQNQKQKRDGKLSTNADTKAEEREKVELHLLLLSFGVVRAVC